MGWMTPKFLAKDEVKNVTLTTTWNDNYQITGGASRVACTNTSTVYYIENRQKSGYDQYLPGHGMVVWKVQYNATRWICFSPCRRRPSCTPDTVPPPPSPRRKGTNVPLLAV